MAIEYVRWYFGAWHSGTLKLNLEERGAYITACNMIYMAAAKGEKLPDDDGENAYEGRIALRTWKRLKSTLIDKGKLAVEDGYLVNKKASEESERAEKAWLQRKSAGSSTTEKSKSGGERTGKKTRKSGPRGRENKDLAPTTAATIKRATQIASVTKHIGFPLVKCKDNRLQYRRECITRPPDCTGRAQSESREMDGWRGVIR